MGEINVIFDLKSVANQIACLLNKCNELTVKHNVRTILNDSTKYIIEILAGQVVGACGFNPISTLITEIKHLVITPYSRKMGLGSRLVKQIIQRSDTPFFYATIRENNTQSLELFKKLGFKEIISENFNPASHNYIKTLMYIDTGKLKKLMKAQNDIQRKR